jgi:hypothetical protein
MIIVLKVVISFNVVFIVFTVAFILQIRGRHLGCTLRLFR